jgi:hypothetical protein
MTQRTLKKTRSANVDHEKKITVFPLTIELQIYYH